MMFCTLLNPSVDEGDEGLCGKGGKRKKARKAVGGDITQNIVKVANECMQLLDERRIGEWRLKAVDGSDCSVNFVQNKEPDGDDYYEVMYPTFCEGVAAAERVEHYPVVSEDELKYRLVTLSLRSQFLPTKEKLAPLMLAEHHPSLFWSLVTYSAKHAEVASLQDALIEICPEKMDWSHLLQQGRQRRQAPQHGDCRCSELDQLAHGSKEDWIVSNVLLQYYRAIFVNDTNNPLHVFNSCLHPLEERKSKLGANDLKIQVAMGKIISASVGNETDSAWSVLNSCCLVLHETKSQLRANKRALQVAMEHVTSARAGVCLFTTQSLLEFEVAKEKANYLSLEKPEVTWWHALVFTLVFPDHSDTGPASENPCPSKMLAKIGAKFSKFDSEKHMAEVVEFALHNVESAHTELKTVELELSKKEENRSTPRNEFQKALSLVREKLVITLVLFAFLSRINPELDECKRRSKCLELLEEAFRLCVGMLCAEAFYKFNDTDKRPSAFITLCRTAVKVRHLYAALVDDKEVQNQVLRMVLKDAHALRQCCPKHQLSEFDQIGMFFLKEGLSDSQSHTEQSSDAEKRDVHASSAERRIKQDLC